MDEPSNIAGVHYMQTALSLSMARHNTRAESTAIEIIAGYKDILLSFFVA